MTVLRLFAVGLIFICSSIGWAVLGATVVNRTGEADVTLNQEVAALWGGVHVQHAPEVYRETETQRERQSVGDDGRRVSSMETVVNREPVSASRANVDVWLSSDHRKKGLMWFATYKVRVRADYVFDPVVVQSAAIQPKAASLVAARSTADGRKQSESPGPLAADAVVSPPPAELFARFTFPSRDAIYDHFAFSVNGKVTSAVPGDDNELLVKIPRDEARRPIRVAVEYRSRGLSEWTYRPTAGVSLIRNLDMRVHTDTDGYDFTNGSMSPTSKTARTSQAGQTLRWKFDRLITGKSIGLTLPSRLNPGPVVSRIVFFAPVSLLFFFTVMVIVGVVRGTSLHPMHYFFLAAAFFAFHLLLAYLVDHINIHAAFVVASLTSSFLVVSYLRVVAGMSFAVLRAGLAQALYLVLFSYSFFFEGKSALSVTVGAVLTLFVLMQLTARVDWDEVFRKKPPRGPGPYRTTPYAASQPTVPTEPVSSSALHLGSASSTDSCDS